jgi:hypothetical protein
MSKLRLVQKMHTVMIFLLIFIFLISTGFAFENNPGNISKVKIDERNHSWQRGKEFSRLTKVDWRNLLNLEYAQQQNANSAEPSTSLAEVYLGRLAEKSKADRRIAGISCLILGMVYSALGIWDLTSNEGGGGVILALGLAIDGVGILCLKIRSRAERELNGVLCIQDLNEREIVGREALFSLADKAQEGRIISGILSGVFSLYCFAAKPFDFSELEDTDEEADGMKYYNELMGSIFGAVALYRLIKKSAEEKALQRYLKESEKENRTGIRLGIDFFGNGRIALSFSF